MPYHSKSLWINFFSQETAHVRDVIGKEIEVNSNKKHI